MAVAMVENAQAVTTSPVVLKGRNNAENFFFILTQTLAWVFFNIYFRSIYSLEVKGSEKFHSAENPLIVVANHFGPLDGFLLNAVAGFSCAHRPFRFMAVTKFIRRSLNILSIVGVIALVYKIFGVFTVTPGLGIEKNLEEATRIVQKGGTVVIFPEGKIVTTAAIQPFRNGAAALAISTYTNVMPVAFKKGHRKLFRKTFSVNFGDILDLKDLSVEEGTARLYDAVTGLYLENDPL